MTRILLVLILIAGIACGGFWFWTTTPQYSISQIKEAIKTHDRKKFDKHVDVNDFAAGMVDDVLMQPMQEAVGGGMAGRWVAAGMSALLKPTLVSGIKEELYSLVGTGSFGEPDAESAFSLHQMEQQMCLKSHDFKRIEQIKTDGKLAQATLVLHNDKHNKDLKLDVQMRDMGGYWQVTRMLNFPEFTAQLLEMETAHAGGKPAGSDSI